MRFETESSLRIQGYVIQFVYYIGMIPFKWDWAAGQIVQITKKAELFRFRLTISLMLLLKGIIVCTFIHRFFSGLVDLRVAKGTNDLILSYLFGFMGMLDVHLLLKMSDLQRTFNIFCHYYKLIQKYGHNRNGKHWAHLVLGGCIEVLIWLGAVGLPLAFAAECNTHALIQLIPTVICNVQPDGRLKHASFPWAIGMGLVHGLVCALMVASSFFVLTMSIPAAALFSDLTREMRVQKVQLTKEALREWETWTLNYRALQILICEINNSVAFPVLAPVLASVMMLHILVLVTELINGHLATTIQHVALQLVQLICVCIYICILYIVSLITQNLKLAVEEKKKDECIKYKCLYLRSLAPVKIPVGHFTWINRLSVFTVMDVVTNQTVDLVIAIES